MKNISEQINKILYEWDPLDIGGYIATDEYRGFIPQILKNINNKNDLTLCLEDILTNHLGIGYNSKNNDHKKALNSIVEKIIELNESPNA